VEERERDMTFGRCPREGPERDFAIQMELRDKRICPERRGLPLYTSLAVGEDGATSRRYTTGGLLTHVAVVSSGGKPRRGLGARGRGNGMILRIAGAIRITMSFSPLSPSHSLLPPLPANDSRRARGFDKNAFPSLPPSAPHPPGDGQCLRACRGRCNGRRRSSRRLLRRTDC